MPEVAWPVEGQQGSGQCGVAVSAHLSWASRGGAYCSTEYWVTLQAAEDTEWRYLGVGERSGKGLGGVGAWWGCSPMSLKRNAKLLGVKSLGIWFWRGPAWPRGIRLGNAGWEPQVMDSRPLHLIWRPIPRHPLPFPPAGPLCQHGHLGLCWKPCWYPASCLPRRGGKKLILFFM